MLSFVAKTRLLDKKNRLTDVIESYMFCNWSASRLIYFGMRTLKIFYGKWVNEFKRALTEERKQFYGIAR